MSQITYMNQNKDKKKTNKKFKPRNHNFKFKNRSKKKNQKNFDYDVFVVGGGSAGLSFVNEAKKIKKNLKIGLCDFVDKSPQGNTWGLGGTCLNVGCIPKKLLYHASYLNHLCQNEIKDYGIKYLDKKLFSWKELINNIQKYIKSRNFNNRTDLLNNNINYFNKKAKFLNSHYLLLKDKDGKSETISSEKIVIATGGRPRYLDIPGSEEYTISSDDLFFMSESPGKTLIIGGSYIAIEIAGILINLGYEVSVLMRSEPLKDFDPFIVKLLIKNLESLGVIFIFNSLPTKIELIKEFDLDSDNYNLNNKKVTWQNINDNKTQNDLFQTVIQAVGRIPNINSLNLSHIGLNTNSSTLKIPVKNFQTNISNLYALGDIIELKYPNSFFLELSPVAIKSGIVLAQNLYGKIRKNINFSLIPTTIFSPIQYSLIGLSQQQAEDRYGKKDVSVYHSFFPTLESQIIDNNLKDHLNYFKIVTLGKLKKIIGIHLFCPKSSEIIQGFVLAMSKGINLNDIRNGIGIHPTLGEEIFSGGVNIKTNPNPIISSC